MLFLSELIRELEQDRRDRAQYMFTLDPNVNAVEMNRMRAEIEEVDQRLISLGKVDVMLKHYNYNLLEPFELYIEGDINSAQYSLWTHYKSRASDELCPPEHPIFTGSLTEMIERMKNLLIDADLDIPDFIVER